MFGQNPGEEFINAPSQAGYARQDRGSWSLLLLILAGIAAFAYWAYTFEIEEITRAEGRVVPSQRVQVVQSLEPGIVSQINVAEGDVVEQGQDLLEIDDTRAGAERGELLEREAALMAEALRLDAEVALDRTPDVPASLRNRAPDAVLAELDVLAARFEQLDAELEVLRTQENRARADLSELLARRAKLEEVIAPLIEEAELTEGLVNNGAVPRIELLRIQSRLAEMRGELAEAEARTASMQSAVEQASGEIELARAAYVLTARQRQASLQIEMAVVQEALRAAEDRVTRTRLKSPIRGTVNAVNVTTLGQVIEPGRPLVEIIPIEDALEIRADILPKDVAFISPGEKASVKVTAYDYLIYGALDGEVTRIGADTIERADGREYFEITIRTREPQLRHQGRALPISPGMTATIDIQTGQRSVLSYLLSPVLRVQREALRER